MKGGDDMVKNLEKRVKILTIVLGVFVVANVVALGYIFMGGSQVSLAPALIGDPNGATTIQLWGSRIQDTGTNYLEILSAAKAGTRIAKNPTANTGSGNLVVDGNIQATSLSLPSCKVVQDTAGGVGSYTNNVVTCNSFCKSKGLPKCVLGLKLSALSASSAQYSYSSSSLASCADYIPTGARDIMGDGKLIGVSINMAECLCCP